MGDEMGVAFDDINRCYNGCQMMMGVKTTVNVIGIKVKASRRVSYPVLKLLIRENTLVLPLRLNMAFTAA